MSLLSEFEEKDASEIIRLIEQFPLATVVCECKGEFIANHIPLIRDKDDIFIGHIAKANRLYSEFSDGTNAIAIFTGEDAYISPNWYPTKKETHRHVPTWNYQIVHLHGHINFKISTKEKRSAVGRLTKMYEAKLFGDDAWRMADAPKDYMDGMLDNIVAFTFHVEKLSAKSKVSQNREKVDFDSVANAMTAMGKGSLSQSMARFQSGDD